MVQTLGRKMTMIALAFPLLAGWLLIGFFRSLAVILVGRFLTGKLLPGRRTIPLSTCWSKIGI